MKQTRALRSAIWHCSNMQEAISIVDFYKEHEELWAPLREFFLRESSNENER